jgi:hypothetical protein
MYAVVQYSNNDFYNNNFKVILTTKDVEYAKKVAFYMQKNIVFNLFASFDTDKVIFRITNKMKCPYVEPANKIIMLYSTVKLEKYNDTYKFQEEMYTVYAVIELPKDNNTLVPDIDTSLLCNEWEF